ncbi:hypothetical protein AHAS_Ahas01G0314000 [Arachis hypogaea]
MSEATTTPEPKQVESTKLFYRDRLVNNGLDKLNFEEIVKMVAEDYKSDTEQMISTEEGKALVNPKPEIEISLAGYDEWCRSWKQALIVKLLEKRVNLLAIEKWINKRWENKDVIRVIDLEEGFLLVLFFIQEDYAQPSSRDHG